MNLSGHHDTTPVTHAATRTCSSIVQLLFRKPGVYVSAQDSFSVTPPALAAVERYEDELEALLKRRDTEEYSPTLSNATPLALATEAECTEIVRLLLRRHDVDVLVGRTKSQAILRTKMGIKLWHGQHGEATVRLSKL